MKRDTLSGGTPAMVPGVQVCTEMKDIRAKSEKSGMFVSGFTFVRNAVKLDYPVVESILSVLDLCDEFIVLVGNSDDGTKQLIERIHSPKIKIYDSVWDDSLREGGKVLAEETDKAFAKVSPWADWAFYLQADEVLHEKFIPEVKSAMLKYQDDKQTEGLLFHFTHFYGSYDYVCDSRQWYRKEIRIIRKDDSIRSFRDAQGFRKRGRKLNVRPIEAHIYHYGWVKPPLKQQAKLNTVHKLWHDDDWIKRNLGHAAVFDYSTTESLKKHEGTHPVVMNNRIAEKNWNFTVDPGLRKVSLKEKFFHAMERATGHRIGEYRNYKLLG